MSILITDDSTIGDLRVLVDALGDGWGIEWTDTGIELTRPVGVPLHPEAVEELAAFLDDVNPEPPRSPDRNDRPVAPAGVEPTDHTCGYCGTVFDKAQGLRVHVARKHGPNADVPDRRKVDQDAARARAAEAL